jgi:hypothetical protein
METLSFRSQTPVSLKSLEATLSRVGPVERTPDETLVVHGSSGRASLYLDPALKGPDEFGLLLDYSDVELAKQILYEIADDPDVTIDNDFGTVLPGDEFLARCRLTKNWDWRR